jgi:hypothetical protein
LKRTVLLIIVIFAIAISSSIITNFILVNVAGKLLDKSKTSVMNSTQTLGMIVVPYFDPENSQWNLIYQLADRYPGTIKYVIINPCSGPCDTPLADNWQYVISILKSKGIKTLGYIFNNSESIANIDYYMRNPSIPTDGIFFDNEGSTNNLPNFKLYADYVHSLGGIVYINPGYNYPQVIEYVKRGLADVANMHEFGIDRPDNITGNYGVPPSKISVIVGNVYSISDMQTELSGISLKGVGFVYIYEKSYDTLPPYFSEEVQKVASTPILKH